MFPQLETLTTGVFNEIITCSLCNASRTNRMPSGNILLYLPVEGEMHDLKEVFSKHFSEEEIHVQCQNPNCPNYIIVISKSKKENPKPNSKKQISFITLPEILLVELKRHKDRFETQNNRNNVPVEFHDTITLKTFESEVEVAYTLTSILYQEENLDKGSFYSGHYKVNVKDSSNKW